jgi:hypothetical protein
MKRPFHWLLISALVAAPLCAKAEETAAPFGQKGELLFSDDFSQPQLGKVWKIGIPGYAVADGALKGWQERDDHGSTLGAKLPLKDGNAIVALRFRLDGAQSINVNLDDKSCDGVHAGHICRVVVRANNVTLYDDKDGVMRNDIYEMRQSTDPAVKAQAAKLTEGRTVKFPVQLEQGQWYTLGIEVVGDQLRATIDGREVGRLKSSGLTHPVKSDLRIGVWGKEALVDDLKVWSVSAAPSPRS